MRFIPWLIAILIVTASIWGSIKLFKTRPSKAAQVIEEKAWPVSTQALKLDNISPSIPLYGRLEAPQSAELKAAVVAEIVQIHIEEGMQLKKGELLIQLDSREFALQVQQRQADIADIRAQIAQLQRQQRHDKKNLPLEQRMFNLYQTAAKRAQQLQQKNLGTQSAIDQAKQTVLQQQLKINSRQHQLAQYPLKLQQLEAKLQQRKALLAQAQLQLEHCQIKAPFSGLIARVDTAVGERVRPGDKLLHLYNPKRLRLRAQIPPNYQMQVQQQLKKAPLRARQDKGVYWQLDYLATENKAQTAGVDALFSLEKTDKSLRLGQFVSVQLQLPLLKQVYPLPQAALYEGNKIYILSDERIQAHAIEILARTPETDSQHSLLLIRGASLRPDMQVVTTQLPNAISGLKVSILTANTN